MIRRALLFGWLLATVGGFALLACALADIGPELLSQVGASVVAASYTAALAARTGGQPLLYGGFAALVGARGPAVTRSDSR